MASTSIYVVDKQGSLARMKPGSSASEDSMQALVARHPELIGDADGDLLLIRREQPIADSVDGTGRWSLDHLFVTRSGVPVLVELKRASDTRLRREMVGQLLDYAANAVAHWAPGKIHEHYLAACRSTGIDPELKLNEFLGSEDSLGFWDQVDARV